jgi:hypothetical protein
MKTVTITVINDLLTDNRVLKTAEYLAKKGYRIKIFGRKLQKSYPQFSENKSIKVKRLWLPFKKGKLFYLYYNFILLIALFFSKKDIMLAIDLDTLLPNYIVSRIQNKKLVYDSHELFTEVPELIDRPQTQKIWKKLEAAILPKLKYCYTVSPSIAEEYKKRYGITFEVIRNLPYYYKVNIIPENFKLSHISAKGKILLYQGALNKARGIDLMIRTMAILNGYILVLAGSGDLEQELRELAKSLNLLNKKVFFLGRIAAKNLKYITANSYLGLSLEEEAGLNYKYALPNKLFDYIMAEVPQIISPLPEMKKIIETYKTGVLLNKHDENTLKETILAIKPDEYEKMKQNCKIASKELNWENEAKKLDKYF